MYGNAQQRARRAGVPFALTPADVEALWPADGRCPVFGMRLKAATGQVQDASPTLDRLNPAWGYVPHNCAVISYKANVAKGSSTASDLVQVAAWMRRMGLD